MQNPVPKSVSLATVVSLEQLPTYHTAKATGRMREDVVQYLETFAQTRLSRDDVQFLNLPSISALSGFFKTTAMDVYDAFRTLRENGYDYQFSSLDGAVRVWRPEKFEK